MSVINTSANSAYGSAITDGVSDMTGREVADAQIYVALRRLEHQGLISSIPDPTNSKPSKRTRGRPRKFYELTATGKRALDAVGAYTGTGTAGHNFAEEREHGPRSKESPQFTPVVG